VARHALSGGSSRGLRSPWYHKLALGFLTAALLLLGAEVVAHMALGDPPPFDQVTRLSFCRLEADAGRWRFSCGDDRWIQREGDLRKGERPRVLVLGASSMFEPRGAAVPDQLALLMPDVEVISLAAPGLSVANLALLVSQSRPLEPDLLLVYAGHNEYSQDVFHGRVQATRLALLPVYGLLARSWLHAALTRVPVGTPRHGHKGIITSDPTLLELAPEIERRFASDLALLVRRAPAPVLLSTLLRNAGDAPTGVLTEPDSECASALQGLWAFPPRAALLPKAQRVCPGASVTAWLEAHALLAQRDEIAAREAFARSLRLDPVPLRAPLEADTVIREVAHASGCGLVDLEEQVGVFPHHSWFVDPIHFSPTGAEAVARIYEPTIRAMLDEG
jgi:hypothetical protein